MSATPEPEHPAPPPAKRRSLRRKLGFSIIVAVFCYAILECVLTYLYLNGLLEPELLWVIERSGTEQHMQADDIRGYTIAGSPTRMACVTTDGRIESQGELKGNNKGFPDRDNFRPQRSHPNESRWAVFGDSFTAGPYLEVNWPDRVEELANKQGRAITLMNFSVFGGGLANWWSVLTKYIEPQHYDLDGVIFLVFVNDLQRTFYVCDDAHHLKFPDAPAKLACGFSATFNPESFESVDVNLMSHTRIVPPANFDDVLAGEWRPEFKRPFDFYVFSRARRVLGNLLPAGDREEPSDKTALSDEQQRLIDDMAAIFRRRKIPVFVMHFPIGSPVDEAQAFAKRLGATYVNAAEAFSDLSPEQQSECWMIDGHWNQTGSDQFAEWFLRFSEN